MGRGQGPTEEMGSKRPPGKVQVGGLGKGEGRGCKVLQEEGFGGIGNSRAHGVALVHRATGSPSKEAWAFLAEKRWRQRGELGFGFKGTRVAVSACVR